jgi:hypothetical protein
MLYDDASQPLTPFEVFAFSLLSWVIGMLCCACIGAAFLFGVW